MVFTFSKYMNRGPGYPVDLLKLFELGSMSGPILCPRVLRIEGQLPSDPHRRLTSLLEKSIPQNK